MRYKKCNNCGYVTNTSDLENNKCCPNCASIYNDTWIEYPSRAALGFYHQFYVDVFSYDEDVALAYDFHEIQPACLLLCALHEILLEGLIADILHSKKVSTNIAEILLEKSNGQNMMALLFKDLENISLKEAINTNFDTNFYDKMQMIIRGRNKYIHGDYFALDQIKINDLLYIVDKILEVFVSLNNSYAIG
jgi:hypothetical protein